MGSGTCGAEDAVAAGGACAQPISGTSAGKASASSNASLDGRLVAHRPLNDTRTPSRGLLRMGYSTTHRLVHRAPPPCKIPAAGFDVHHADGYRTGSRPDSR